MKSKVLTIGLVLVALIVLMIGPPAGAQPLDATGDEIEQAITNGIAWSAAQQNADGSWGTGDQVAKTGFAVVKLEERAFDLGYDSPFDPGYAYSQNVIEGLNYIFSQAASYGPGTGMCFAKGGHESYNTGIAMMAIAANKDPDRVVNVPGSAVDGWTYQQVVQANVDFFAWAQNPDGAWRYWASSQPSDQSNTGYVVLGLAYAEDFAIAIPASVKTGLNNWIDYIQCSPGDPSWTPADDGGSGYTAPCSWVNELKAGNLIFEMCFVGDDSSVQRFQDALAYIERLWRHPIIDPGWGYGVYPASYQAMYTLMKGLEYCNIDLIDTDGDGERDDDWFNQEPPASPPQDFASVLVAQQNPDGSWPGWCNWGDDVLCTEWALLTLEKVAPPPPVIRVAVDIKPGSCPNPLNTKSKGVLPVAVLGTEDFDVKTIDPATIQLAREGYDVGASPLRWSYEDVATPFEGELCECHDLNGDGYVDLTLKFDTQEVKDTLDLEAEADNIIPLIVMGNLNEEADGTPIEGSDCVWVLKKGKK